MDAIFFSFWHLDLSDDGVEDNMQCLNLMLSVISVIKYLRIFVCSVKYSSNVFDYILHKLTTLYLHVCDMSLSFQLNIISRLSELLLSYYIITYYNYFYHCYVSLQLLHYHI